MINAKSKQKILITGHRGFIGSILYIELTLLGYEVIKFTGNVNEISNWKKQLQGINVIYHLASIEYNASKSVFDDLDTNAIATLKMLETIKFLNISPKIIFASSSNIYSESKKLPIDESFKDSPSSIWSVHKLLSENYLKIYSKLLGIQVISLRLSNVFGPSTSKNISLRMALNKMINMSIKNHKLTLYANKNCIRDWIFIDDVIKAFLTSLDITNGTFNQYLIGTGENITIFDYANLIKNEAKIAYGIDLKVIENDEQLSPMAMRNFSPSCEKFISETGWRPKINSYKGIKITMEYFYEFIK